MDNKKLIEILVYTLTLVYASLEEGITKVNEESVFKDFKKMGEIHPVVSSTMVELMKINDDLLKKRKELEKRLEEIR